MSTLALIIGLVVVNVLQPGVGLSVTPSAADVKAAAGYGAAAPRPTAPSRSAASEEPASTADVQGASF